MDIHTFIANYQEAFGQHAELPIAFWYSAVSYTHLTLPTTPYV